MTAVGAGYAFAAVAFAICTLAFGEVFIAYCVLDSVVVFPAWAILRLLYERYVERA